jgi:hypothetical protein
VTALNAADECAHCLGAYAECVKIQSRLSVVLTIAWVMLFVIVSAVWSPGWLGQVGLLTLGLVGAGVLWNLDAIVAAWRQDRGAKRSR